MARKKSTLTEVYDLGNIERAWRWIKSNPDARYKGYFRDSYSEYSFIENHIIKDLSEKIRRNTYTPSHSCKVFVPKSSGILRPYTLLTVEDQIVYQAMINIIAEKLVAFQNTKANYHKITFGNLYTNKSSIWFYKKWSEGYRQFDKAAREAFNSGLKYSASFDLTACYDSIDHNVLRHFLEEIGCTNDFNNKLIECLVKWTNTEKTKIYHNHGIPQGPLSSGLLSEVVLKYFDIRYGNQPNMRYMRYVDDIRLFAKSDNDLRLMLIKFDKLSKEIGLFPQSSKIEIHEVKNIEDELKSISNPTEFSVKINNVSQDKIIKRLLKLTERYKIDNVTRFKYVLAYANPTAKINDRVWKIYKLKISNYESIFRYFRKYDLLPKKIFNNLLKELKDKPVYSSISAEIIKTIDGRVNGDQEKDFLREIKKLWKPRTLNSEILLHSIVGKIFIEKGLFGTRKQLFFALKNNYTEWYTRLHLIRVLESNSISILDKEIILNDVIKDNSNDVACAAAILIIKDKVKLTTPIKDINKRAILILKEGGIIKRKPKGFKECDINIHFNHWLNEKFNINWKNIFNQDYKNAIDKSLICRLKAGTDTTAWVNSMDIFNDLFLDSLFRHDIRLSSHKLGDFGTVMGNNKLKSLYPKIYLMTNIFHEKRLESGYSHAYVKKTGKPTKMIDYSFYERKGKKLIKEAFKEIETKW